MKVLDRYLVAEMLGPFFVGVVGFILVLTVDLLFTMADLIINKRVPFWAVLNLLLYKLPSLLVLTFPVSTLFGTAMSLGRLSKDNELTALRTSGISLWRIAIPILLVGALVTVISFITNERIVPHANHVSSNIIRQIIYKQPLPEVKDNVFFKDNFNRYYYVQQVDSKKKIMRNLMVFELIGGERFPRVIMAEEASFTGQLWELRNGVVHKYDNKGFLNYEANFTTMRLNIYENILSYSNQKTVSDMTIGELKDSISSSGRGGANTYALQTELYMKYAIPLACFVFALVGIPFSLTSPRAGRTWGLVVTIVFMFTFYVFASVFRSLGKGGIVSPVLAAFVPPLTGLIIGTVLLFRENRNK